MPVTLASITIHVEPAPKLPRLVQRDPPLVIAWPADGDARLRANAPLWELLQAWRP